MKTPRIEPLAGPAAQERAAVAEVLAGRLFDGAVPAGAALAPIGPAPCTRACPAGINVKRYVGLVAEARYEEALAVIRRDNPLAAVCGYLCNRPCELECARRATEGGEPVPIRALKRLAARIVADSGARPEAPSSPCRAGRVAVVGGGPSGLTAARDLRLLGYGVTLLEARRRLGGKLAFEVPEARLPRWAVDADVAYVLAHGVEVRTGVALADRAGLEALRAEGFDAVVLAIGAERELGCGLPGEGASDAVWPALRLLGELAQGRVPTFRDAVVLGGDAVAFAAAGSLAATGRGVVTLVYPRERRALPVDPATLAAAEDAGVRVRCLVRADEIEVADGMVTGVVCTTLKHAGRVQAGRSGLAAGRATVLEADLVVTAGGREPRLDGLGGEGGLQRSPLGTLAVDPETLETDVPRVFGTGEAVSGPRSVIEAVALGRRVARAVHRSLSGEAGAPDRFDLGSGWRLGPAVWDQQSAWEHVLPDDAETPFGTLHQAAGTRAGDLEPAALRAARRCLRCGPCADCATCSPYCPEEHLATSGGALVRAPRGLAAAQESRAVVVRAQVEAGRCRACGLCEEHCPYAAPRVMARSDGRRFSAVDERSCRGCGVCVGLCPTGAMSMGHFDDAHLAEAVDRLLGPPEVAP